MLSMQRRSLLKLGLGSAVVLALAGGTVALIQPGWQGGKLSAGARGVLSAVGQAVLAGTLPQEAAARQRAVAGLLDRIETFIAACPPHVQAELSQLLGLLDVGVGRRMVAGLSPDWQQASTAELTEALQSMRLSSVSLRQQAYQGLHDIVCASYFSGQESWAVLGYPGPKAV